MSAKKFIKEIFTNRVSLVLVAIHFGLLLYVYWERRERSTRPFHFHYESDLFKTLYELDIVALELSGLVTYPLYSQGSYFADFWWIGIVGVLVQLLFTSLQWAIIGYFVWKIWKLFILREKQ